jgi:luciferase family oxidoreductase group 1
MKKNLSTIPLSVLDLATIREGHTAADAFRNSLMLAQGVEKAGYKRYWFAEHHNMESVASSSPALLIGHIAGGTSSIRVGAGGIMLPNHAPLIVAEQFGTLASLYPDRIDLGLGRAPGTDQITAMALRRNRMESVHDFPQDVVQLQTLFSAENRNGRVRAIPGEGLSIPIWILGSSTDSARLAAVMGLPYAFASHFAPTHLHHALQLYREGFQPSERLSAPYAMACVNVIVAETDAEAQKLATSFYNLALGLIRNNRKPLQQPVDSMEGLWTDYEQAAVQQMMAYSFVGSPQKIKESLNVFLAETGVDELMVAAHIYDPAAKLRSYELLAGLQ